MQTIYLVKYHIFSSLRDADHPDFHVSRNKMAQKVKSINESQFINGEGLVRLEIRKIYPYTPFYSKLTSRTSETSPAVLP